MSRTPLRRLALALVAICSAALAAGSLGAGRASAADCTVDNIFRMAQMNTCNSNTILQGSAVQPFYVLSTAPGAQAVVGWATAETGPGWGVFARSDSSGTDARGLYGILTSSSPGTDSAGVAGFSLSTTGNGPGVNGRQLSFNGTAPGVYGETVSTAAGAAGVRGSISSSAANAAGVRGDNNSSTCCGMGVAGFHSGQGIGVYGEAQNGFAVSGFSPNNWSGYFQGSVNVVGTLYKSSGAFRIDNPIDPAHSYLQHSFVESPDMKNVYDGNVVTNGKGFATVKLPAYFQALNKDFRYQLTIVGARGWRARVVKEIAHNRFTIESDEPRVKVSWQVTGIRHDAYANAHRIQTVVPKSGSADGKYIHPELYGKPMSKSVVVLPGMTHPAKPHFNLPAQR